MHVGTFELFQIANGKATIAGTAGENHRAGCSALVIDQFQYERLLHCIGWGCKTDHLSGNRYFSPEFLGLVVSEPSAPSR